MELVVYRYAYPLWFVACLTNVVCWLFHHAILNNRLGCSPTTSLQEKRITVSVNIEVGIKQLDNEAKYEIRNRISKIIWILNGGGFDARALDMHVSSKW